MRNRLIWVSAILTLLLNACGTLPTTSAASPASSCVNAGATHRAYVVVQHLSGSSRQKCVGFAGDTIDGQTLMDKSGIEYQAQTFSFGKGMCQIDNEPKQFSECFPKDQPYWALFVETGGAWATAQTGYTAVMLRDNEAIGWHYVPATDASPSPPPTPKAN